MLSFIFVLTRLGKLNVYTVEMIRSFEVSLPRVLQVISCVHCSAVFVLYFTVKSADGSVELYHESSSSFADKTWFERLL